MYGPGGDSVAEQSYGKYAERVDEEWAHLICDFTMNGMYARDILSPGQRELCAIAALTVMQEMDALESHIRISLNLHSVEVIREVILQMAVLAGFPLSLHALRLLERIEAEQG